MAGHEGVYATTNQNLEIVKVDTDLNVVLVKGNVPGPKRGLVVIKSAAKNTPAVSPKELVNRAAAKEE
jgi:large subunit ribosomal protein L3